jgi:hypothetical protein
VILVQIQEPAMLQILIPRFGLLTFCLVVTLALSTGRRGNSQAAFAQGATQASDNSGYLPFVMNSILCGAPTIVLDYVPPIGGTADLRGHVTCVTPTDYKIAVYINVAGWWTKPYYAWPLTAIQNNGTWTTDITTGGCDPLATDIAVFLIPNGYTPPIMSGGATLPPELFTHAVASIIKTRKETRMISFSGHTWNVKYTPIPAGPGPNYFSDDPADVWVDGNGYLHLRIVNRGGKWYSTEVICTDTLEYGAYTLTVGSPVDLLDKNAVLGFFSWDTGAPQYNYREIDIEFSRWGEDTTLNAQYVVQPWDIAGNRYRFNLDSTGGDTVHHFDWRSDRIQFESRDGSKNLLQSWTYTNTAYIPPAGAGNARINLWLLNGWPPSNNQNVEVIFKSFKFTPTNP